MRRGDDHRVGVYGVGGERVCWVGRSGDNALVKGAKQQYLPTMFGTSL